jgi:hypothetical protein
MKNDIELLDRTAGNYGIKLNSYDLCSSKLRCELSAYNRVWDLEGFDDSLFIFEVYLTIMKKNNKLAIKIEE